MHYPLSRISPCPLNPDMPTLLLLVELKKEEDQDKQSQWLK